MLNKIDGYRELTWAIEEVLQNAQVILDKKIDDRIEQLENDRQKAEEERKRIEEARQKEEEERLQKLAEEEAAKNAQAQSNKSKATVTKSTSKQAGRKRRNVVRLTN